MTQRNYCFDIEPIWGSHASILEQALGSLSSGSLVIEHGAGMYSSTLIARYDVRVVCIEEATGWRSWAEWLYNGRAELVTRAKRVISRLPDAALVFIDGAARERGDLLRWALDAGAPTVIAHDTEDGQYGYRLTDSRYAIEHDSKRPQTTTFRLIRS